MRLTRRDVIAALAAAGVTAGGGGVALSALDSEASESPSGERRSLTEHDVSTLVAAAEVLYPSAVEDVDRFVTRYVRGRVDGDDDRATGIAWAVEYLDDYANAWYDSDFVALDAPMRDEVLHAMDADAAAPDPEGSDVERVRYYVVNDLLFALYTTPTGGTLVGLENPPGYPGGTTSYQRGPRQ